MLDLAHIKRLYTVLLHLPSHNSFHLLVINHLTVNRNGLIQPIFDKKAQCHSQHQTQYGNQNREFHEWNKEKRTKKNEVKKPLPCGGRKREFSGQTRGEGLG